MSIKMNGIKIILMAALITFIATPAFARGISFKDAGIALWVFLGIGAVIVLLQLIPAGILFFSFVGTTTTMALRKGKKAEEEVFLPGVEPVSIKK